VVLCCVTCRNSEWLKPSTHSIGPIGLHNLPGGPASAPTAAPFCRPDLLRISNMLSSHARRGCPRSFSSEQRRVRCTGRQIHSAVCWVGSGHAQSPGRADGLFSVGRGEVLELWARLHAGVMADPVSETGGADTAGGSGGHLPEAIRHWRLRHVVRIFWWPRSGEFSGSASQAGGCGP